MRIVHVIQNISKYVTILILLGCSSAFAFGQGYWVIGGHVGASNYAGDLTPDNPLLTATETHPTLGVQLRYEFDRYFSIGIGFNHMKLSGSDQNFERQNFKDRNLSFETNLQEIAMDVEFRLLHFHIVDDRAVFTPYVSAGIAGFHFNPRTFYNGQWIELQPLGTEGQGTSFRPGIEKYSRYEIAIPVGGGVKFQIGQNLAIFLDVRGRYTFTDYIDDISTTYPDMTILAEENGSLAAELSYRTDEYLQTDGAPDPDQVRGSPRVDDHYMTATLGLQFAIERGAGKFPFRLGFRKSRVKCPNF